MFRSEIKAPGPKVTSIKFNKYEYYMNNLIQSLSSPHLQQGNYSHMDGGIMDGWWRGVGGDGGDDLLRFPIRQGARTETSDPDFRFRDCGGGAEFFLVGPDYFQSF